VLLYLNNCDINIKSTFVLIYLVSKKARFFSKILVNFRKSKVRKVPRIYKILVEEFEIKVFTN
jgi:hypothetical protein